jgi:ABC-type sugar transport system substrate-binding protein
MMRKTVSVLIVAVLISASFTACSKSEGPGGTTKEFPVFKEGDPIDLAFVFFGFSVDIHVALRDELIRYAQEKYNCTVHVYDYKSDPTLMMQALEDVIVQEYDAVFLSDITGTAENSGIMQRLHDAGIRTSMYCVDTGNQDFLQGLPAYDAGTMLARMSEKWIDAHFSLKNKAKIKFGIFGNPAEGVNSLDRVRGMREYITENIPTGEVVMELVGFDTQAGYDGATNMIQAYPDLDIILSYGDGAGVGANEALQSIVTQNDFGIFTIDGSEQVLRIMATGGLIRGSVAMGGGVNQARELLDNFLPVLYGKPIKSVYYFWLWPVTFDNLYDFSQKLGYTNFKQSDITVDLEPLKYWNSEPFDTNTLYQ